jgi:hypothetical protein
MRVVMTIAKRVAQDLMSVMYVCRMPSHAKLRRRPDNKR